MCKLLLTFALSALISVVYKATSVFCMFYFYANNLIGLICGLTPVNQLLCALALDFNSLLSVTDCESVHTRGHNRRLYKKQCNVNCRQNAFVCRNINVWNRLPAHIVNNDVTLLRHYNHRQSGTKLG